MTNVTIIGAGNMGSAIARVALAGGNAVQVLTRDRDKAAVDPRVSTGTIGDVITGDVVILALPYPAVSEVLGHTLASSTARLSSTSPTRSTSPPSTTSSSRPTDRLPQRSRRSLPAAHVVKAFNTNFAATVASGSVGDQNTTVLIAGDNTDAKSLLATIIGGGGLTAVDAGSLKRARELEAVGFLQLTLAVGEKTSWDTGFALVK